MGRVAVASVTVGAALVVGYLLLHQSTPSEPNALAHDRVPSQERTPVVHDVSPIASARLPNHNASAPVLAGEAALPPTDVKLANVYPQLKKLADEGNPKAACRLAYELNRCRTLPILALIAKNYAARLARVKESRQATETDERREAQIQREYAKASNVCSEFPPAATGDAWRYALQAAQAGSGPAIMNFVGLKMGLDERNPDNTAQGWVAYKELGPGLLQHALDSGMPEAYEYAASLHAWKNPPQQLVPYDPVRALAMYQALSNVATDEQYKDDLAVRITTLKQHYGFTADEVTKAGTESARMAALISQNALGPIDGKSKADPGASCDR